MKTYKYTQHVGILTDAPKKISLSSDAIMEMRYDRVTNSYVALRPSRIKYPTARELIKQYRQE